MKNLSREKQNELNRKTLLQNAAKMFLQKGYQLTTIKELCANSKMGIGSFINLYGCKENLMRDLVKYVLEAQFEKTAKLIEGKTKDKVLFYAAETTLQLYMAESSEHIRELYSVAYSLPNTTEVIQETITSKLEEIFKEYLPNLETKDFYMLEIASGGIMRGFMTIPCNMWFSMEEKVKHFLTSTFRVFELPKEKTKEALDFISQFDYKRIAKETVDALLDEILAKV